MYEHIETEISGRVGVITLRREKQLNALNQQLMQEVLDAGQRFAADPAIGALVITGNARAFAAGADITELAVQDYASMRKSRYFSEWDMFAALPIAKIAAVSGYALGGGCELALMCDLIIAAENARFGQPEIKIGCIPGMGGTQRLTRLVGRAQAMDMILTGRMVDASEALRIGLCSRVVALDDLMSTALEAAATIAGYASDIVDMAREAVDLSQETFLREGVQRERQIYHSLYGQEAQIEGMNAFMEKREPNFNSPSES